jgi:DNA ligase (NAD+)
MGCDGFGPVVVHALWTKKIVQEPIDFWKLTEDSFYGLSIPKKVFKNLLGNLAEFKSFNLETVLCAMGIDGLGSVTSKAVARKFRSLKAVLEADLEKFIEIDGIAEKQAGLIVSGLKKVRSWLEPFLDLIEIPGVKSGGIFEGKSFLFTGTLSSWTRSEAEKAVEFLGGSVASSVSKNLDYLVVGENAGSKIKKAQKFVTQGKLKILDENLWMRMMDQETL